MPDSTPSDDVLGAVSGALRGDRTKTQAILDGVRQRAQERARDNVFSRLDGMFSGAGRREAGMPALAPPRPMPRVSPGEVARRRDLVAVARTGEANDRRAFAALARHRRAIENLRRSQDELTEKVGALQAQADQAVAGLLQGVAGLGQRVQDLSARTASVAGAAPSAAAPAAQQTRQLAAMSRAAQLQSVTNIINNVQATAFGQRGSVFARNNLLLAGNQLLWTFMDPLLKTLGVVDGVEPSVAAYLAPLASFVTGQFALANQQHVRFVSGVAEFDGSTPVVIVSLRDQIADGEWERFRKRTDVPVTATVLDGAAAQAAAEVVDGAVRLRLTLAPAGAPILLVLRRFGTIRVAWMVDTGADVG